MRLFAVRVIKDKQAVGFFWATDSTSLWWMIDSVCDPGVCEYRRITGEAAVTWQSKISCTLGTGNNFTDEDELTGESKILKQLKEETTFDFSFEDYLYGEVHDGWVKVPYADEKGGGIHEIFEEERMDSKGKNKRKRKS